MQRDKKEKNVHNFFFLTAENDFSIQSYWNWFPSCSRKLIIVGIKKTSESSEWVTTIRRNGLRWTFCGLRMILKIIASELFWNVNIYFS